MIDLQPGISEIVTAIEKSYRVWNQSVSVQSPDKTLSQKYHRYIEQIDKVLATGNKVVSLLDGFNRETPLSVGKINVQLVMNDRVLSEYRDKKDDEKPIFFMQLFRLDQKVTERMESDG